MQACGYRALARAWSLDASMPILSAMARTTVGAAPVKRPPTPSSFTTLRQSKVNEACQGPKHEQDAEQTVSAAFAWP